MSIIYIFRRKLFILLINDQAIKRQLIFKYYTLIGIIISNIPKKLLLSSSVKKKFFAQHFKVKTPIDQISHFSCMFSSLALAEPYKEDC